uniref:Uncharacterized protein n=1 Tax=Arundo donax TaxID=35708 RepID=A0A0A9GFX4_ARUDO
MIFKFVRSSFICWRDAVLCLNSEIFYAGFACAIFQITLLRFVKTELYTFEALNLSVK